ncbi:3'(2'),5'-bisphosphate nucleotidase CysQ, partial [candidate division KSB1 bacterium]
MNLNKTLLTAIKASIKAGEEIMKVYESDFTIEQKEDKSPLTLADKKSHEIIQNLLISHNIPILSEEGKDIPYEVRQSWEYFWMVDPLDGTKEFIKRNGEFTVNIALICKKKPIQGIIYVPVSNTLFFASEHIGSYKISDVSSIKDQLEDLKFLTDKAQKLPDHSKDDTYRIVASRSHMSPETESFINDLKKKHTAIEIVSSGSSLKLCLVAEGKANIYPRFAPTMEWDTAAGQSIVEFAGGKVTMIDQSNQLVYNKENLLNPWFIV